MKRTFSKAELKNELEEKKEELQNVGKDLLDNLNNKTFFNNVAFVIFDKISDYEEFYSWFPNSFISYVWLYFKKFFSCCFRVKATGKDFNWLTAFKVEKAPDPEDIIWENLNFTDNERRWRKIKTYTYSIFLTLINLAVILGLNFAQVFSVLITFL